MKLIIMCGYPASGKSTWIKAHSRNHVVVSLDWIRREVFGHQFHRNAEFMVLGFAKSIVRLLLSQNKNVILDSTSLTRWIRQEWYNIGIEYNADVTTVWVCTSKEVCEKRNAKRTTDRVPDEAMDRLIRTFESPNGDPIDVNLKIIKGKI